MGKIWTKKMISKILKLFKKKKYYPKTYQEKIDKFQCLSGWDKEECEDFLLSIYKYLDSCGYFLADYNIHGIQKEGFEKYYDKPLEKWILDFALQVNMECGKKYNVELKED